MKAEQLRAIGARGRENGVEDLKLVSREEARAMEPEVECHEALFSPSTGIIDSHALMLALQGDAEAHGAVVVRNTAVRGVKYDAASMSFTVQAETEGNGESGEVDEVECDYFVNATGLHAPLLVGDDLKMEDAALGRPEVPSKLAKGTYFKLSGRKPFRYRSTFLLLDATCCSVKAESLCSSSAATLSTRFPRSEVLGFTRRLILMAT